MKKLLSAFVFGIVLFSNSLCWASRIEVQVFHETEVVQDITLPAGKIRVAAKSFEIDSDTNTWELSGDCSISISQGKKEQIRLSGDTAKIVAAPEDVEWQISSPDPVDISNVPLLYLANVLKKSSNVKFVRLTWYYGVAGYKREGTGVYNRENHTVDEYFKEGDDSSGKGGMFKYSYTGVTDEMIYNAVQETNSTGSPFSFSYLTKYGAVRHKLK